MTLRIAVSTCHRLYRESLRQFIQDERIAPEGKEVYCCEPDEVAGSDADLLIADYHAVASMPLDTLVGKRVKVILLDSGCLPQVTNERLLDLIPKGLVGILPANTSPAELKKAVDCALSGELWMTRKRLKAIISDIKQKKKEPEPLLSAKEQQIVKLVCRGYRNKEIMEELNLTEQSVKSHLRRINRKFGVGDRLQLALRAIRLWPEYLEKT